MPPLSAVAARGCRAEELAARLREEAPSALEHNAEQPEELLAEDAIIQELGFGLDKVEIVPVERVFEYRGLMPPKHRWHGKGELAGSPTRSRPSRNRSGR